MTDNLVALGTLVVGVGALAAPDDFREQVAYLAEEGFAAITLEQLFAAWLHGGAAPVAPVVLTFDDGYASQYTDAMPVLEEHGWPGVLNLKVDSLASLSAPPVRGGAIVQDAA